MRRRVLGLAALVLCLRVQAADPVRDARWREDLRYLAGELPSRHPDLFFQMKRVDFERAVAELDQRIPELPREQSVGRQMPLVVWSEGRASHAVTLWVEP